jgi:hypothetical protein
MITEMKFINLKYKYLCRTSSGTDKKDILKLRNDGHFLNLTTTCIQKKNTLFYIEFNGVLYILHTHNLNYSDNYS